MHIENNLTTTPEESSFSQIDDSTGKVFLRIVSGGTGSSGESQGMMVHGLNHQALRRQE